MAIQVTHTTQATGTDAGNGEIRKAQWNEAHTINMATSRLLGRTTAGDGAAEEITVGTGLTLSAGTLASTGISSADIQEFTSTGTSTWTKPAGAKLVYVLMFGGGGGGGSGRRRGSVDSNYPQGGSGAAAGVRSELWIPAISLGSTETVVVGAGGNGASAITVDNTNGSAGSTGGETRFGTWIYAKGGSGGIGGSSVSSTGTGSVPSNNAAQIAFNLATGSTLLSNNGGAGLSGNPGSPGGRGGYTGGGGGGGGAVSNTGTSAQVGGAGGLGGVAISTTNSSTTTGGGGGGGAARNSGAAGANSSTYFVGGSGGGGGGGGDTAAAGSGGNGGYPTGGGGGGGASAAGFNSGAGGNGGNGYVRVITFF